MSNAPADQMVVFNMRLPRELIRVLDDMRRQEDDIPTRSEMARRCIEIVGRSKVKRK
jgi:metal-responsive CopG/Arc/MetJ family transcriptional regulator